VHHELVRETQRLSRLVENVLETSRLEAGRRSVTRTPLDVATRARDLLDGFRDLASSREATLRLDAPSSLDAEVDPEAFERVLVNLVDNALKYGLPSDGPRVVDVHLEAHSGALVLRVSDRGPGIPSGERERVFQRFVRASRADASHRPGSGLGLALVRELARAHGGDARLEEREGGGLTVVVTLA
jgi:signal transduction histidine kinase